MTQKKDFSIITELPQTMVPVEQLERYYQRYQFASRFVQGKRVLEIGCGGGQGLALLRAAGASLILGTDIHESNLSIARSVYHDSGTIRFENVDANNLPFANGSFDCILMFEVIYYLSDLQSVLNTCMRILAPGGVVVIESANKEWSDFNPSPFSTNYYSARELNSLLIASGFLTKFYSAYYVGVQKGFISPWLSLLKRTAVKLHLIPNSMAYKKYLKRIFLGKHVLMPSQLHSNMCCYKDPQPLDPSSNYETQFKVIFGVGEKNV